MFPVDLALHTLARGKLSVFLFHKVPQHSPSLVANDLDLASFERYLDFVQEHFQILPLGEAVDRLKNNRLPAGVGCITFDDGYPDWLTGVVPLLLKRNIPATFFITTGQFDGMPMWHERISCAIQNVQGLELTLPATFGIDPLPVHGDEERRAAVARLEHFLKYQPLDRREILLAELESLAAVSPDDVPRMTAEQLRLIHGKGFAIGAHTINHPILTLCTSAQARDEIGGAREILAGMIGGPVTSFAYPNGHPVTDYSEEHIRMVRQAGYLHAVTTDRGVATSATSLFQIPRFTPWGPTRLRHTLQIARNLRTRFIQLPESTEDVPLRRKFRTASDDEQDGNRHALMVAFHFPPQAGSSGILRTLNFVKHLPEHGWKPVVLTAHPRAYESQRKDLLATIPPGTDVIRAFALDASRHLGIAGKYPLVLALPDRWSAWWLGGVVSGMQAIERFKPKVIWSTYPITTAHMIAATLAQRSGLPWIADFRDPMINASFPTTPLQRLVRQRVEAKVMEQAVCCVFTTERAADLYRTRFPYAAAKCRVIENGYDEQAFTQAAASRYGIPDDKMLLLHSGLIYPKERNPSSFFAAISRLLSNGQLERSKLCIRFRAPGDAEGAEVSALVAKHGLADIVDIAPPIPYHEAIGEMLGADFLLVFQGAQFNAQIPAKIYEYLRARRPLIAMVDHRGDTAAQLRQFSAVYLADISSQEDIAVVVSRALQEFTSPDLEKSLDSNVQSVRRYSRDTQAKTLANLFDITHQAYVGCKD